MRALSVAQPWASLLVLGAKRLETRPWRTEHRGPLLIHASRAFPAAARALQRQEPFRTLLAGLGDDLPLGAVVGAVDLAACDRVEDLPAPPAAELALGDFGPGRWAWRVERPRGLATPLPARGRLGLFDLDLPPDALEALAR
jgi:hypothetical protein